MTHPFKAGDRVRCLETADGNHGARVVKGQTYIVSQDQNPNLPTLWICDHGRWRASMFEPAEGPVTGPIRYDGI